jgi:hypothetical protein
MHRGQINFITDRNQHGQTMYFVFVGRHKQGETSCSSCLGLTEHSQVDMLGSLHKSLTGVPRL